MVMESAVIGVALALPVWLLVEEVFHQAFRRMVATPSRVRPRGARVPAPRAA